MVRQVFLKAKSVGMSLGVKMVSQWGANNCIKKSKLRWFFGVNRDFCLIPLDSLLIYVLITLFLFKGKHFQWPKVKIPLKSDWFGLFG